MLLFAMATTTTAYSAVNESAYLQSEYEISAELLADPALAENAYQWGAWLRGGTKNTENTNGTKKSSLSLSVSKP